MRKFWFTLRAKTGSFSWIFINDRIKRVTKLLKKLEAKRNKMLKTTLQFAFNFIPGYKTSAPKELRFKTLCLKCYRYFYFQPSVAMLKGENIAYTNCTHCNQEHISVVYPELPTGKTANSYLKTEFEITRNQFLEIIQTTALQIGLSEFNFNNPKNDLEKFYEEFLKMSDPKTIN